MYNEELTKRTQFTKNYVTLYILFYIVSTVILLFLSLSETEWSNSTAVTTFGNNLASLPFVLLQIIVLFVIVITSKRLAAANGIFVFPKLEQFQPNWNSVKKAPFARRSGVYLRYWFQHLRPLVTLFKYTAGLLISWLLVIYVAICFGAPLYQEHWETGTFVTLLCCQSVWPIILIEGFDLEKLQKIINGHGLDILKQVLYLQAAGATFGAWLGAFLIPLDWDRPWQVWPLTCVIGSYCTTFLSFIISLARVTRENKTTGLIGSFKKST